MKLLVKLRGTLTVFIIRLEVNRETYLYTKVDKTYLVGVGAGSTSDSVTKQYVDDHTAETILTTGINSSKYTIYNWDGVSSVSTDDYENWAANAEKALIYNENEQRYYAISKRDVYMGSDVGTVSYLFLIGDIVGFEPKYDSDHKATSIGLKSTMYQIQPNGSFRKIVSRNADTSDAGVKELTLVPASYFKTEVSNLTSIGAYTRKSVTEYNIDNPNDVINSTTYVKNYYCTRKSDSSGTELGTMPFAEGNFYLVTKFIGLNSGNSPMLYQEATPLASNNYNRNNTLKRMCSCALDEGAFSFYWTPWYGPLEEAYYDIGYLQKEDAKEYYYKKKGREYTCSDNIGYTGTPNSNNLKYALELRNPDTTRLVTFALVNKYLKSNVIEESDSNTSYRGDEFASLSLTNAVAGNNKIISGEATSATITCYSYNLTSLKVIWNIYNSSGGVSSQETVDVTPSSFTTGDAESYDVSFTFSNIGIGKLYITGTTSSGETYESAGQSFEVIQGGEVCFTGDTPILTSSGLVNIQDLKIGDKVISYNEVTKRNEEKAITNIKSHEEYDLYYIITCTDTVRCTYDHPFYIKDKGKVLSRNLRAGNILIDKDGNERRIQSIAYSIEDTEIVYDIAVEDSDTYYVGKDSILVYTEDVTKNEVKEEE